MISNTNGGAVAILHLITCDMIRWYPHLECMGSPSPMPLMLWNICDQYQREPSSCLNLPSIVSNKINLINIFAIVRRYCTDIKECWHFHFLFFSFQIWNGGRAVEMPLFGCCVRKVVDVKSLDYRHSGLSHVPNAVFNAVHTIETLYLDSNQIKSLPRVSVTKK